MRHFSLSEEESISVAKIIDLGERETSSSAKKGKILGKFQIKFASGDKKSFELNSRGVKCLDDSWQTTLSPESVREIRKMIEKSVHGFIDITEI